MNYCCDWCGEGFDTSTDGVITMHEKAPEHESVNDEIYNFCTYKCLRRWLAL